MDNVDDEGIAIVVDDVDDDNGRGQLQVLYIQMCNVNSQVRHNILQRLDTKFGHDVAMCIATSRKSTQCPY